MANVEAAEQPNFIELTAELVSAYVANNSIQRGDIPGLIEAIHASFTSLGKPAASPAAERPIPPVSIKKSINQDYLISLEDGRRYKSLKRHLSGRGLTPEQYREKWSLPVDYPMVAPSYAKQRSELAKSMGLGRQRRVEAVEPARPAPKGRSRGRSAA
jgi:predicted transcriptional regulator